MKLLTVLLLVPSAAALFAGEPKRVGKPNILWLNRIILITGMYQTSIGAQNHRSGVGQEKIHLPSGVELVPRLFQHAGYYTCNGGYHPAQRKGKTDYNFELNPPLYDGTDWSGRKPGQPFFAQIQLLGGKTRDLPAELATARAHLGNATPTASSVADPGGVMVAGDVVSVEP